MIEVITTTKKTTNKIVSKREGEDKPIHLYTFPEKLYRDGRGRVTINIYREVDGDGMVSNELGYGFIMGWLYRIPGGNYHAIRSGNKTDRHLLWFLQNAACVERQIFRDRYQGSKGEHLVYKSHPKPGCLIQSIKCDVFANDRIYLTTNTHLIFVELEVESIE